MGENLAKRIGGRNPADKSQLKFVFDSTPLIHLIKAGLGWMIDELKGEKYIPPTVYAEVVESGKAGDFDDALVSDRLVKKEVLMIKKPAEDLISLIKEHKDIHLGEAEVVSLAKELNATAIIDDSVVRSIANMHGVKKEGSYGIILRTLQDGCIGKDDAKEAVRKLVASGWRCEVKLFERMLRAIEGF